MLHEPPRELDPDVKALLDREESAERIVVSDDLRWAHKLVRGVVKDQKRARRNSCCSRFAEREERIWEMADITVGPELLERALKIMNALLKASQARGFKVEGDSDRYNPLSQVTILGQTFKLRMFEPNRQVPHVLTEEEKIKKRKGLASWIPKIDKIRSGELILQVMSATFGFNSRFRDGKKSRLEEQLNDVVKTLIHFVDSIRMREKEQKRWQQQYEEEQRQRLAEEERRRQIEEERKREQERVNELLEEVTAWRRSCDLREYLENIRQRVLSRGEVVTPESAIGKWLQWAEEVACKLIPQRLAALALNEGAAPHEDGLAD